jgi:hypothetical protein
MIQTIFFISSIYIASSNRLLLQQQQWVAPTIPTGQPQIPYQQPQIPYQQPQQPQYPSNPQIPAQINPYPGDPSRIPQFPNQQQQYPYQQPQYPYQQPQAPYVPQLQYQQPQYQYQQPQYQQPQYQQPQPQYQQPQIPTFVPNPQYTPIYNPSLPYDPINNPYGYQNVETLIPGLNDLFCPTANSCSNRQMVLFDPADSFRWTCEVSGTCAGASLTLSLNHMSPNVEAFEGIFCKAGRDGVTPGSCEGIIFKVDNQQLGGASIEIEKIECSGEHSCENAQFILGPNVKVLNVLCDYGQCDGCKLKVLPTDIGTDCTTAGIMGDPFPL